MFGGYKITLHRVHDTVRIREGEETLRLVVDGDPMRMVAGLNHAQKMLMMIGEDTTEEEKQNTALYFAGVIFGDKQAQQLLDFYRGDGLCVVNICGSYFRDRLNKLLTKAQKKSIVK